MPLDLLTRLTPLRRVRCPFCFERFPAFTAHLRCDNHDCKTDFTRMVDDPILTHALNGKRAASVAVAALRGPWWVEPRSDRRRGFRRYLDWLLLPESVECQKCGRAATLRLCPRCHSPLPDAAVKLGAGHIAVFGPQSVGKTTYVTVLIHELDHRAGPEQGFVLDPLTDEVRDRYEREYHEPTYGGSRFGIGEDLGSDGPSFRHSHSATPSLETNRGVLQPLVFRLTRRGKNGRGPSKSALLSFFDTAGEDWEMNVDLLRSEARYLSEARGLVFLLDPLRIRAVAHDPRITLTEKERRVPAADYLADARKLATFFRRTPVDVPLAIVLNKLDRWGRLLPESTRLYEWATGVPDPNEPGLDAMVSDEVESILRHWGASGFLEYIDLTFPNHRFFACSALGDAATEREDQAQPLPTPLLVERPVLWLLEEQDVLSRR
jgi:GTPase SAR1 family protein